MNKNSINRRDFLSSAAVMGAAGTLGAGTLLASCGGPKEPPLVPLRPQSEWNLPADPLPEKAIDGRELKVGLVGCGGQGTGDLINLLRAADGLTVVALGDTFPDRINDCRTRLKDRANVEVPDNMCFSGFDSYQKVIEAADIVLLVTAPFFRPMHFKAAVEAGKHVFMEKPMGVDAVGARQVLLSARQANDRGLCIVAGTQRHHQRSYNEAYKLVQSGVIGEIVSGNIYWNQSKLWHRDREPGQTVMEWMIRDWVNWNWLSGDHIVEQHVHNIDVFNWFSHMLPEKCVGFGARHRRPTGDQYDMFSVDYTYPNGVHVHSMCRQIDGCNNLVGEYIQGTKGSLWTHEGGGGTAIISDLKGNEVWKWDVEKEREEYSQTGSGVLQLANWVDRIRKNQPINQATETAESTLTAIMGRQSAYTGAEVTWEQIMASDMDLTPNELALVNLDVSQYPVPVPGRATQPRGPR